MIRNTNRFILFGYYGSKSKFVHRYPAPMHNTIIEPFAGAANYSAWWYDRNVILYELNPMICGILKYMVHASPEDIMSLPLIPKDGSVKDYDLPKPARALIGFWMGSAITHPRLTFSPWGKRKGNSKWGKTVRKQLAHVVERIKHWKVRNKSCWDAFERYRDREDVTWFIDPPYRGRPGMCYKFGSDQLDYKRLGEECQRLKGQVIVCEGPEADWLPFRKFIYFHGGNRTYNWEMIWTKNCRTRKGLFFEYEV